MYNDKYDFEGDDDKNYQSVLNTIYESRIEKKDNLRESIMLEDANLVKKESSSSNNCLKVEDHSFDDIFTIEDDYQNAVNKFTNQQSNEIVVRQLQNMDIYSCLSKKDVTPNIRPLNAIENMVEATYYYDKKLIGKIAEEICYIQKLGSMWRPIGGDGNCFYRSVMFSYMEHLIFQRDVVMLKRITAEISQKFDIKYTRTQSLPLIIRSSITEINKPLIISIFSIIIDTLDSISPKVPNDETIKTLTAYDYFVKIWNCSKSFDIAMVVYLRFKLYEYISDNQDKMFSEDFPVQLGNLLPMQYETEKGDFLFSRYYTEELLKLYTYAEKIVIYLTPFVLKVNLKLIFYDFGNDCNIQTKEFSSYLADKTQILLLYRKAHYDLAYTEEYYTKWKKYLDSFSIANSHLKVVSKSILHHYQQNMDLVDVQQSKIFNKKESEKKKAEATSNNSLSTKDLSKDPLMSHEAQALLEEIKHREALLKELEEKSKLKICRQCSKENSKFEVTLPCGCVLCDKKCATNYAKVVFKLSSVKALLNDMKCPCAYSLGLSDLMQISNSFSAIKIDEPKIELMQFININKIFVSYCMSCLNTVEGEFEKIKFEDENVCKFFNGKSFIHVLCKNCVFRNCNMCKTAHNIKN